MVTVKLELAFRSHGTLVLYTFTANYMPWTYPPKRRTRRRRKKNSGMVETRKAIT